LKTTQAIHNNSTTQIWVGVDNFRYTQANEVIHAHPRRDMAERLNNDFQFLDVARQDPEKKDINVRKAEFVEIYKPFTAEVAANQPTVV
jgi:hypothetical protein